MADPLASLPAGFQVDSAAPPPPPDGFTVDAPAQPKPFGVLPVREDQDGSMHFDPTQGVLGSLSRAVQAPYAALTGKLDPFSPEGQQAARDMALTISPGSAALGAGERVVPGVLKSTRTVAPKVPTAEELKTAASAGYDAARATGAEYPGSAVAGAARDAQGALNLDGFIDATAPRTSQILRDLQGAPDGSVVTIASLDGARKALGKIFPKEGDRADYAAAQSAIRAIDNFIARGGRDVPGGVPGGAVAGPAAAGGAGAADGAGAGGMAAFGPPSREQAAADLIVPARGNSAAAFRSDKLNGIEDAADLRAAAANSGQNGGNALRQRLASLLLNEGQSRRFSSAELADIRDVVMGTATSNTLRRVSNLLGGGGGLGQAAISALGATGGAVVGGPTGAGVGAALLPVVGAATRSAYNGLVRHQLGVIDEATRMRSPLYRQNLLDAPLAPQLTDSLLASPAIRSLLLSGDQSGQ